MTNETTSMLRVFKIGATRITENETTAGLNNEQIREILKRTYPEVAHATIREREQDGMRIVEYLPQPGRKG
jgi:sensor histidine kinase YesM